LTYAEFIAHDLVDVVELAAKAHGLDSSAVLFAPAFGFLNLRTGPSSECLGQLPVLLQREWVIGRLKVQVCMHEPQSCMVSRVE